MNNDTVKTFIDKHTIDDIVASFLYATSSVNDDEDISNITLGKPNKKGLIPLTYVLKKKH